ncbi:MAG TPA: hypothetical protein VK859_09680, partial [bacterium]|nr:hypothetical protein [bacterium]
MRNRARVWVGCLLVFPLFMPGFALAQSSAHPGGIVDTGCGPWNLSPTPLPVVPMDNITVYAFSQTGNNDS